jgi:purine-binding chemotaxis protein CheW
MAEKISSYVTFKISSELYGVNIMEIREVVQLCEITPIPNAPDFVDGVINLRGEIIPVVDLGKRFKFKKRQYTEEEVLLRGIIVLNVNGLIIGIIIDQVKRVMNVDFDQIQPPPQIVSGVGAEYVQGVVKLENDEDNFLIILNEKKLFNKEELLQLSS